jgi:adenylate cyclase
LANAERRLAAITFIDVVGYTLLSQRDEESALKLLEEYRGLLRPIFAKHGGKEVKTMGDGFLVESASALEAVRCAFEVQQVLHDLNSTRPSEKRILARVGIHVGDVIHAQNDIYGDAVNIASRIEPLAEPGGICISEQVFAQIRNRFEFPLPPLGSQNLKNVETPVQVYRISLPWNQTAAEERVQAPRTRIAVLPFSNISPDPSDEYFADGMTEELINTISHNHQLKVIARTSVGRFKGSHKSVSEIGKEIGVGSILEGSVRKAGNKIRVTAQLIDAATEEHMWSDNYDRQLDDVFSIQSEIAKSVSEALMVRLVPEERKSVERRATGSSASYVRYLKGRTALRDRTESGMKEARKFFEDAISGDANYAEAYAGLADALYLLGNYRYLPMAEAVAKGKDALSKALALDDGLAEAHNTLANYLMHDYRFAEAEGEFKRAIALSPSYALAHHWYGIYLWEAGRLGEALEETRRAEELDPLSPAIATNMAYGHALLGDEVETQKRVRKLEELDPTRKFVEGAMALLAMQKGDFEAAVVHQEKAVEKDPDNAVQTSWLGFDYAKAGRRDEAVAILEKIRGLPDGTFGKPFYLAIIHGGLGEIDEMFSCLDRAFDERSVAFRVLRFFQFDPKIRDDSRYVALFQRARLAP